MSIACLLVNITLASIQPHNMEMSMRSIGGPGHKWEYSHREDDDWQHLGSCSGKSQSPINIETTSVVPGPAKAEHSGTLDKFFTWYNLASASIVHNGHSVKVEPLGDEDAWSTFKNPATGEVFKTLQFHFHFPSEHTIDGKRYDGEMHLVGMSPTNYSWAVVQGYLLEAVDEFDASDAGMDLFNSLGFNMSLPEEGKTINISDIKIKDALAKASTGGFYHYTGSLTTPPCTEIVSWFVSKVPMKITASMIAHAKEALGAENTFRAIQDVNARPIVVNNLQDSTNDPLFMVPSQRSKGMRNVVSSFPTLCGFVLSCAFSLL